jgi:GT2 family glycosyltransferase
MVFEWMGLGMIPVLGVPVLNRPDLLYRMLDSIDTEIGQIVIIDNGGVASQSTMNPNERVIRPGQNLGVAASWNLIMQVTPLASWWAIVNFDLVFAPGDLDRLAQHMDTTTGPEGMVATLGTFSAFGVSREAINRAGWFDENFHPAYFEDNDFQRRCDLAGVTSLSLPTGLTHSISSTIASDHRLRDQNYRTFPMNSDYYRLKWGGSPLHEKYPTPFNKGGDIRDWHLDINRLAGQSWEMELVL